MSKIQFGTTLPNVLAYEYNMASQTPNQKLLSALRTKVIAAEKTGSSRDEIFDVALEEFNLPSNIGFTREEYQANAAALAVAMQESANRACRLFEPSTVVDLVTVKTIGMLKGVASDKVSSNVERMLTKMLTDDGKFSAGDHVLLNADVIDMIETTGSSEGAIRTIMSASAGIFFVDETVKLSRDRDTPTVIFGIPVFHQPVPGRKVKAVRFNFSGAETNPKAALAASLFAKGLAAYYNVIDGVKATEVMNLGKTAEFKHVAPTTMAWVLHRSIATATEFWEAMPSGLDDRIDHSANQAEKKAFFDNQNQAVDAWMRSGNIQPYQRPGISANTWPVLKALREAAIEKGVFTYPISKPKNAFADWDDLFDFGDSAEDAVEVLDKAHEIDLS